MSGGSQQSGLVINVSYDASCNNAPAAFKTAVAAVVSFYESQFTDPITISIDVGYGEVDGESVGGLSESLYYLDSLTYSQLKTALVANAASAADETAISTLPATDPTNGGTYWLSQANEKALGLLGGSSLDGYIGVNSSVNWDYSTTNTTPSVPAGEYDLFSSVAHEISEVMGRELQVGGDVGGTTAYSPLDLFHYSASGVRDFSGTTAGYFSINGGVTDLNTFNTNPGGDFGDWAGSTADSYNAYGSAGVVEPVSAADLTLLNVIGYDAATSGTGPQVSSGSATAGDYNVGKALTLTLNMSEAVNVIGTPTLTLNDGGTATYVSGTGTNALTFSYTVGAGQNTSGLAVTGITGTIADLAGNALSTANLPETFTGVIVDTTTPSVSSVAATAGDYNAGKALTLTLNMSEAVNVTGTPTLTLNDGGSATYTGGTGTSALTFSYTVGAGQNTAGLAVMGLTGTIADLAGNALSTANLPETFAGVKVDTTTPSVSSVSATAGDYDAGKALTLTLNMSEAVNVTGTPTLTLNDGGSATYASGTGTNTLTFSYTVGAGQNTAGLAVTGITGTIADLAGNALSTANLPETFAGVIVDTATPVVSSVAATAGDYDAGKALTLTLNMSEAVNVTGTPTLTLNDGGIATYVNGTGTSALTFSYTVGAGQNIAGLAVMGLTGTIADLAGNALSTANLPETFAGVTVDTTTPSVSSVSATAGDYNAGKALTLTLNMSEAVNVTGTPTLTLNDGGTATYTGGTGTSALTFSYTVGAGQNTSGLAVTAVSGTIADLAGNTLSTATLPETFAGVTVDTTAPVVSTVSATAGDYNAGKALTLTLNMSEAVNVTGTPTLTLNDGGTASYVSGTGTNALTFSYTVGAGQNTAGLAVTGLTGTIADLAGNALSTANLPETFAGVSIDTTTPSVSSVSATAGDYDAGKALTLTLNMSEAVNVTGTPTLTLNDGGSATYVSGTGTSALTFSYTVGAGQNTSGLAVTGITGTIANLAGTALSTANLPETFTGVIVDTAIPVVSTVSATAGDYNAGKALTLTLNMSEAVNVTGTPTLTLNDGGSAAYVSGTGTNALTFSYTVGAGQNTSGLAVTGITGTIADLAGNALSTSNLPETFTGVTIDTATPVVSTVSATAGDYDAGKALTLTLHMSEAVNVTGTPTLTLNDGGNATYVSGTGTSALTFSYTVGAGQNTSGLAVTGITGTIADLAGNALSTSNLPETFAGVIVDTTTPTVSTVAASAGDYDAGKALTLTLHMSEGVNITGTPTLTLNDGGSATYTGGAGTNALTFSYTVGAGQNTSGLAVTGITGTIADLAGNALSTANLPESFTGVIVDTMTPSVSTVAATAGDYDAGKAATLTLNMSEAVNVTGTPTLTLNDGGNATYVSGTGTNALTFSYTVAAGQNTSDLTVTAVTGTIADLAGNAAEHLEPAGDLCGRSAVDTATPSVVDVRVCYRRRSTMLARR